MEYVVICDRTGETRTGYGLMVWDNGAGQMFRDLCGRAEPVLDLAERCNAGRLDPGQLREVVEDFLGRWDL